MSFISHLIKADDFDKDSLMQFGCSQKLLLNQWLTLNKECISKFV
tara:strand:- start:216 stop:350 length:135 start_codon:yes stop_codon:yes gene_type:complete